MYDAFISYSHAKDKPVAQALQSVIQSLGKPWYKRRAARIFRDDTSLAATPALWGAIEAALDKSSHLILLLSEESARSKWVAKEVEHWLQSKSPETILIALTGGNLEWNEAQSDFNWDPATPLGQLLQRRFPQEPKWIDLRQHREQQDTGLSRDSVFRTRAADFAAAVRGLPKEDLLSEELMQQRRALRLAIGAVAGISLLAVFAGYQAYVANLERDRVLLRKVQFITQMARRQLSEGDPATAIRLGLEAFSDAPVFGNSMQHPNMFEAYKALYGAVRAYNPTTVIVEPGAVKQTKPYRVVFSPNGDYVASLSADEANQHRLTIYSINTKEVIYAAKVPASSGLRFDYAGRRLAIRVPGAVAVIELASVKQYVVVSDVLNSINPGPFAFIGDTDELILHWPSKTGFVDQSRNSPGLYYRANYKTNTVRLVRNSPPGGLRDTTHVHDFDASGRFFLAEAFQEYGHPERCIHVFNVADWAPVAITGTRSAREDRICIQSNPSLSLTAKFSDYGHSFFVQVDQRADAYHWANGRFEGGIAFQLKTGSIVSDGVLARNLNPAGQQGLFLEIFDEGKAVNLSLYDGPEDGTTRQFSLENNKILSAIVPLYQPGESERLLVAFADGHIRKYDLRQSFGQIPSGEAKRYLSALQNNSKRAAPSCKIGPDGWLTFQKPDGGAAPIRIARVVGENQPKLTLQLSSAACDKDGLVIYTCDRQTLKRFERQSEKEMTFASKAVPGGCEAVRASSGQAFAAIDTAQQACLVPFASEPKLTKTNCTERAMKLFIDEEKKTLSGMEFGMGARLLLLDYDEFMKQRQPLDRLIYTMFEVNGDTVEALSPTVVAVVMKPHPSVEHQKPELFTYFPFRERQQLVEEARRLVSQLPGLSDEQRRRLGIELTE